VLYGVVEEHLESFYRALGEHGTTLPAFAHAEFERYLRCGRLEHGFVRVKCTGCRHEHLVAFSCKCRGLCPSCGARRMAETAAGLVERVYPRPRASVGAVLPLAATLGRSPRARLCSPGCSGW